MRSRRPAEKASARVRRGEEPLEALILRARQLGQSGKRMEEAVQVNSRILELDPDNLAALTRRGLSYLKLDDYPSARGDLTRALRIYPNSTLVADALKRIDRGWDAALERSRMALVRKPKPAKKRGSPRATGRRQQSEETRWAREAKHRLAEQDKSQRRAAAEEARRRAAEEARKRTEEELRAIADLAGFEECYALGVAASKSSSPNYAVAIAAFKKAYKLDPRRKVRPGGRPDPGLFEVPTRLAAAYRLNGQLHEAQKTYEWVLQRRDDRFAKVGLAAVHEDNREHVKALELYESVLDRHPRNAYALRGVARTLASLGRVEEATEAYEKAAETGEGRKNTAAVVRALERLRDELGRMGEVERAQHVDLALEKLQDSGGSTQW